MNNEAIVLIVYSFSICLGIKEENVSPLRWQKGVVTEVHPGGDKLIRVVTAKTVKGYFKRPIQELCVLPCND
jgi:hypothetical protein